MAFSSEELSGVVGAPNLPPPSLPTLSSCLSDARLQVICHLDGETNFVGNVSSKAKQFDKTVHTDRAEGAWLYFSALSLSFGLVWALRGLILDGVVLSSNLRHY